MILAGDVTLDVGRLVADIGHGPVPLTRLEFLLLRELAEHVGQSVPKGSCWPPSGATTSTRARTWWTCASGGCAPSSVST